MQGEEKHKGTLYTEDFDRFWQAYPRKIGKKEAAKAWSKSQKERPAIDKVIEAIEAQSKGDQWTKDGGQFIPHPATWLNQGRWDDDVVITVAPKKGRDSFI